MGDIIWSAGASRSFYDRGFRLCVICTCCILPFIPVSQTLFDCTITEPPFHFFERSIYFSTTTTPFIMLLSKTSSTIHWSHYSNFTSEKYLHLVWCKANRKGGPPFHFFVTNVTLISQVQQSYPPAKTVTKSNTQVVFLFLFQQSLAQCFWKILCRPLCSYCCLLQFFEGRSVMWGLDRGHLIPK